MHRVFSFFLVAMLLPILLTSCTIPEPTPTEPSTTQSPETEPPTTDPIPTNPPEEEVYHGMTASMLDAIPSINYNDFRKAMDSGWNFGWDTVVTMESVAEKVDFTGSAANEQVWHLGTEGEACKTGNSGWGVELRTTGKGNVSYMYNKVRIPTGTTEFRVWAVGNTDYITSGEGAMRTVAVYKDENGEYVTEVMKPLATSFTGMKTTKYYEEDGTIRFKNAKWNMPDTVDGCVIKYDISNLPKGQDVIIFIEGVGMGNVLGDEYTEAAEGTPAGEVMSDLVIVKRVMLVASTVPVEEGTEITVPTNGSERELLFKIVDQEGLYMNFLPPTEKKHEKAPVLFLICGGGWIDQSRASILSMQKTLVSDLRAEGFAVVASDYRVISDNNGLTIKDCVIDLMDAARYLAHYADALEIDAQKIATSGHSAGGHLALMLAWADESLFEGTGFEDDFKIFCSAPIAGPTVLYKADFSYRVRSHMCGGAEGAKLLSPFEHITADTVPTLLIHGDADDVVNIGNATSCVQKAESLGAPVEVLVSEWGNHVLVSPIRGKVASPNLTEAMHIAADWIVAKLEALNAQ